MDNLILLAAAGYIALLLLLSRFIGRHSRDNNAFYRGNRQSPWWAVAFGMIGASISGVTFVSVPGMVRSMEMTYLQTCLGFVLGYIVVATVLLPIYYRLNLTSIYSYLQERFGDVSRRTGAAFFLLSKLAGASIRLYLVCFILQGVLLDRYGLPFPISVAVIILLIWLYTRQSGIRTIVWSDCLQTIVLLCALVLIIRQICLTLGLDIAGAYTTIRQSPLSKVFEIDDPSSRQYFWKQFLSGIFIPVVMTGLDQDMMQKNLTCRTLRQSQLNMTVNGVLYLPVNLLFLSLGVLLYHFCDVMHISAPLAGDALLPTLCASGTLGSVALLLFVLGIIAAAFSSADSAMTSLTTSFCVDIMQKPDDERLRRLVHPLVGIAIFILIMIVQALNSTSVIDAVYIVCGYTYGPLLGLFAFGLLTKRLPRKHWVPVICILSPLLCFVIDQVVTRFSSYRFGYELLMLNGLLTFFGLFLSSAKLSEDDTCGHSNV